MNDDRSQAWTKLCEFTGEQMKVLGVPGVSLGVLHKGELQTTGFGVTNADHPLPVTDETFHQIGSITKTFTGTLAMRLVEEGKLDLDATVRTYLPKFKVADEAASAQATVRHLMTHTGGWVGDFFQDTGSGSDALETYVAEMADLEQLAPLGAHWSYNNAGFAVLGRILEVVTGKAYANVLREMLLEPLGLTSTHFDADPVITQRFVVGHRATPTGPIVLPAWSLPGFVRPMGALICTVKDLLRYAAFHLGDGTTSDGEHLLGKPFLDQMQAPHANVWGDAHWGLTWSVDHSPPVRRFAHGGGTTGQITQLTFVPEHGLAVAVLTNADQGSLLVRDVTERALEEYCGTKVERPKVIKSTEAELAQYVGRYERPFSELEIGMLGGRLIGQIKFKQAFPTPDSPPPPSPPPMTLGRCAEDRLLVMDGRYVDVTADAIRNDDGSIGWLRISGRLQRRTS